ncbi:hypothetical protein Trco_007091 [Trichoderma cornu-damae]|uniref:Uncharacterized protein n=1 Tax=Trichoderma cornu-damae TaxID=654480 RepID=A0A9P8QHW7_9HYPO|nr:hypothetical protein Trco_007091 [Trichoderma cornu-damae]
MNAVFLDGVFGLFAGFCSREIQHLLLVPNVELVQRKLAHKLVRLGGHVKRNLGLRRQLGNLKGADPGNDAAVLGHGFGTDKHHVDLAQQTHDVRDRGLWNLRDGNPLASQLLDHAIALLSPHLVPHVDDPELSLAVLRRSLQQPRHRPRRSVRKHALALPDEPPPRFRNAIPRCDSPSRKQASIAQQVLPHGVEAAVLLLKRSDEILKEEVSSRLEGQRVLDGGLEAVGMGLDGV